MKLAITSSIPWLHNRVASYQRLALANITLYLKCNCWQRMSLGIVQPLVQTAAHVDTLSKQRSRIGPDDKVQTKQLGHTQIDLNEYFWSEEKKIVKKSIFSHIGLSICGTPNFGCCWSAQLWQKGHVPAQLLAANRLWYAWNNNN